MAGRNELQPVIERVAQLVGRHRGRGLTEQDTKNALIEPILGALGWPKDDLDLVRAEYRHTSKYNPVDYALLSGGRPVMLVEAKALDVQIADHKIVSQVVAYAATVGVEWALVTNGAEWRLYSALALVDAGRKRVFAVDVSQPEAAEWLPWIAPARLAGNLLGNLWRLVHAERQVREVVNRLFSERNDALVSLISAEGALAPADVALALQVLQPALGAASVDAIHQIVSRGAPASAAPLGVPASPAPTPAVEPPPPDAPKPVEPSGPFWPITVAPTPGTKPVSVALGERAFAIGAWGEMLLRVVSELHALDPGRWDGVFIAPAFEGRKRRLFQRGPEGLRSPKPVPGGYAELNLSSSAIVATIATLAAFFGLEPASVTYAVRAE